MWMKRHDMESLRYALYSKLADKYPLLGFCANICIDLLINILLLTSSLCSFTTALADCGRLKHCILAALSFYSVFFYKARGDVCTSFW